MQAFGVGLPELLLVLIISVLVVGPDRLPQVAADLARWVRRFRAYAQVVSRELNDAVKELETEVGASREEWKEIGRSLQDEAKAIERDVTQAALEAQRAATDTRAAAPAPAQPAVAAANGVSSEANGAAETSEAEEPVADAEVEEPAAAPEETPWFEPTRSRTRVRRRSE